MNCSRRAVTLVFFLVVALAQSTLAQDTTTIITRDPLSVRDAVRVDDVPRFGFRIGAVPPDVLPGTLRAFADSSLTEPISFDFLPDGRQAAFWGARGSTVFITYRRDPAAVPTVLYATDVIPAAHPDSVSYFSPVPPTRTTEDVDLFGGSRITRSGSITRGVIAGNRRDATIESGLRMQLSGEILDGVNLRAVLSDENTPIVPEGTTQRIDEFDKVFIEVESQHATAQLGDFDLSIAGDSYARVSRKLQGAQVTGRWSTGGNTPVAGGAVTVAGAAARGIYRRQTLQILDGVQGPYRLEGQNGERFIILIPGSESVYLDGVSLVRGETEDYVVDYATAEVTFTARRVMSPDRRVSVEFQYTTNQFTRTLLAGDASTDFWQRRDGTSRATFGVSFVREADGNGFADEFGLSAADSLLLAQAGDNVATRSGATPVEYDPEAPYVHYIQSVVESGAAPDTIFVALAEAPADSQQVYRVQFSRVASGTGSYVRVGRQINGIQYEHVGAGGGDYEPIRLLPQPSRQELLDIRAAIRPVQGFEIRGELAHAQLDRNRLSSLDSEDDRGAAFRIGSTYESPTFFLPGIRSVNVAADFDMNIREATFTTFDRVRSVEFERDWNVPFEVGATSGSGQREEMVSGAIRLTALGRSIGFESGRLALSDAFESIRYAVRLASSDSVGLATSYAGDWIDSQSIPGETDSYSVRHRARASVGLLDRSLNPFVEFESEDTRDTGTMDDSLLLRSIRFQEIRPGVGYASERLFLGVQGEWRSEERPLDGAFVDAQQSTTVNLSTRYRSTGSLRFEANAGLRTTRAESDDLTAFGIEDRESVVLGFNGAWRPLERAVGLSWLYEGQTERTPRLQEVYVRIGPEQGEYVWVDSNDDGVIAIEEFVLETTPNEGTYARTFVPSDSLFGIVGVKARGRLDLRPENLLRGLTGRLARALSHVTSTTVVEVSEKNRSTDIGRIYALRQRDFRRPGLTLNGRLLTRQLLTIGRPASRVGIDVTLNRVATLADLAAGLEERTLRFADLRVRYRVTPTVAVVTTGRVEQNAVLSEAFASRTFDLNTKLGSVSVSVEPTNTLGVEVGVEVGKKSDRAQPREAAILKVPVNIRYRAARRLQLSSSVEFADVRLTGDAAGLSAFELTDGRGAGRSALWSLVGQYVFNQYLRGSIAYDGRSPAGAPTIHTMRMQLSAVF